MRFLRGRAVVNVGRLLRQWDIRHPVSGACSRHREAGRSWSSIAARRASSTLRTTRGALVSLRFVVTVPAGRAVHGRPCSDRPGHRAETAGRSLAESHQAAACGTPEPSADALAVRKVSSARLRGRSNVLKSRRLSTPRIVAIFVLSCLLVDRPEMTTRLAASTPHAPHR